ncbi:DUF1016 N-terminal domain-containing protein [Sulfurimonas hydrogeniphila]|uniref:DUF1016 N-terminal domain-containing protein n=1 Tax=Sulfurimonas hydrogeniphila TaxID=2509341 RepID=UPI001E42E775|nr:DUF1016 N-terminal domain-containing protein [Sulfurimonas hydrogeniphila]
MIDKMEIADNNFYNSIKNILQNARDNAYRSVNFIMVEAYWHIGQQIVEEEQRGKERAEYGKALIKELSHKLTEDFGKGFSKRNIYNMKKFYLSFLNLQTLSAQLTWSHYVLLLRIEKRDAREWYMQESTKSNWSVRAMERQIHSHYYECLLSSREKAPVEQKRHKRRQSL